MIERGEPDADWRKPDVLDHPRGAWPVERFIIKAVGDPDAFGWDAERIERYIREGLERDHDRDFADVLVVEDDTDDGGYVGPLEWAHPGGHGYPDYGPCDCGPVLPDDWFDHIKPLVQQTSLCEPHGQVAPCERCDAVTGNLGLPF